MTCKSLHSSQLEPKLNKNVLILTIASHFNGSIWSEIIVRDLEMTRKYNRIPAIKSSGDISGKAIIFTISTGDPEAPG